MNARAAARCVINKKSFCNSTFHWLLPAHGASQPAGPQRSHVETMSACGRERGPRHASHHTVHRSSGTRDRRAATAHRRSARASLRLASPADASISPQRGGHHWRPPISQLARSIHRTSHTLTLFIQGHRSLIRHRSLVSHTHTDHPPRAPAPRSRVASHSPVFPSQEKSKPFQRFKWYRTQRSVTMKATQPRLALT